MTGDELILQLGYPRCADDQHIWGEWWPHNTHLGRREVRRVCAKCPAEEIRERPAPPPEFAEEPLHPCFEGPRRVG